MSMKFKLLIPLTLAVIVYGGWLYAEKRNDFLGPEPEKFMRGAEEWVRYRNPDLGLYFEYRKNPDGYSVITQDESQVPNDDVAKFISIFNTREHEELLNTTVPREGPPNISILIFENPDSLSSREWADKNKMVSGIDRALSPVSDTTFANVPAVRYLSDGLYVSDTIVAANGGRVYLILGSYIDESSPIRRDFLEMLQYFSFI